MSAKVTIIGKIAAWLLERWLRVETADAIAQANASIEKEKQEWEEATRKASDWELQALRRRERLERLLDVLLTPLEHTLDDHGSTIRWDAMDAKIAHRFFVSGTGMRLLQRMALHARRTLDAAMWKEDKGQRMVDAAMGIRLSMAFLSEVAGVRVSETAADISPTGEGVSSPEAKTASAGDADAQSDQTTAHGHAARAARIRARYRP